MESHSHDTSQRRKSHGILKMPSDVAGTHGVIDKEHIKFDEEIIAEHDKSRGTRQKISEPKTPYADEMIEDETEVTTEAHGVHQNGGDIHMHDHSHTHVHVETGQVVDEEIKKHLDEAERNKQLNAQLQKEAAGQGFSGANFNDQLKQRLDNTQQELDEEERKHQEFLKKRKDHYKNELKAAQLLRAQSRDEDEDDE